MKIALLGDGKMGQEIEKIAVSAGHEIVLKIHADNLHEFTLENVQKADVAIEFTTPHSVVSNIKLCAEAGVPVVVGTTGWYDKFDEISSLINTHQSSLFYATNFSIGVHLFFKINEMAAALMSDFSYELSMDEIHHTQKLDAPSGTAITTAERIMNNHKQKNSWVNTIVTEKSEKRDIKSTSSQLMIRSVREEAVPGTHTVYYDSEVDTIEISHIAHSRKGFAEGAVKSAEWIIGKKGIYTMDDMLSFKK